MAVFAIATLGKNLVMQINEMLLYLFFESIVQFATQVSLYVTNRDGVILMSSIITAVFSYWNDIIILMETRQHADTLLWFIIQV